LSTSPWPYRPYADHRWLGGDHGPDRDLSAVVQSLRATVAGTGEAVADSSESVLAALVHLAAMAERIDWAMLSLVGEARAYAVPWSAIGASLGVTKQAAQQRFSPYVKQALEQAES
jgi:hypothetical protein